MPLGLTARIIIAPQGIFESRLIHDLVNALCRSKLRLTSRNVPNEVSRATCLKTASLSTRNLASISFMPKPLHGSMNRLLKRGLRKSQLAHRLGGI